MKSAFSFPWRQGGKKVKTGTDLPSMISVSEFLANYPTPAFAIGPDGGVLEGNDRGAEMMAALSEGRGGRDYAALVDLALTSGLTQTATINISFGEEASYWEIGVVKVGQGEGRDPISALVLCRDVTLERNLRSALVDSRQRYKDLVEVSSDFAWETGRDGAFVFVSPRGAMGYSAKELVGLQPRELVVGENRGLPFSARAPLEDAEIWLRRADGRSACLLASCVPLFDDGGNWRGARGLCRDVTEERERDAQLARARHREQLLTYIVRAIRDVIEPRKMLDAAATAAAQGTGASGCRIYRVQRKGVFTVAAEYGDLPKAAGSLVSDLKDELDCAKSCDESGRQGIAMTTRHRRVVNGAVCLWRKAGDSHWNEDDHSLLVEIVSQLGIAIEQINNHEELERISSTDSLTGLMNRRVFFENMERRMSHAVRTKRTGAVCYVDFDNFKLVNDVHGHFRGDEALKKLAQLLVENTRANDFVGRLGGDEFAVWLEETNEAGAAASAENLLKESQCLDEFSGGPDRPLGLSIGIAVYHPDSGEKVDDLLSRADGAMYEVKNGDKGGYKIAANPEGTGGENYGDAMGTAR